MSEKTVVYTDGSEEAKRCSQCSLVLPFRAFHQTRNTSTGRASMCRECRKKASRADYVANRERKLRVNRAWLAANPDYRHRNRRRVALRRFNGMTEAQYGVLLGQQEGRCALCATLPDPTRAFAVDHDHKTGAIRGLLCTRCNTALERVDAIPGWVERAANFVLLSPALA